MSSSSEAGPLSAAERMLSGAIAGAVSRTVTAPLDRVRILYQVNPAREFTFRAAMKTARTIYGHTGAAGLWRGNGAALVRVIPYSGILFCSFPAYQTHCGTLTDHQMTARFVAGALAGATATTVTYPLDLMRARMAAHWGPIPLYSGYAEGFFIIVQKEGFNALFHGLNPTLLGIVPYSGIGFMTFETLKSQFRDAQNLKSDADIPTVYRLAAGAVSGFLAQSTTYPLHVIRRRMQVGGAVHHKMSLREATATIWRAEGINGLFKGITLTYAKGPVSVALGFTLNDLINTQLRSIRELEGAAAVEELEEALEEVFVEKKAAVRAARRDQDERPLSTLESLCAGGVAGCLAKTVISPADRVKIWYQVGTQQYTLGAAINTGRNIVNEQGFLALWRGNGATLMRVIPYSGTTYLTYDRYLGVLTKLASGDKIENFHDLSHLATVRSEHESPKALHVFLAGSLAGATASTVTYPLDLMRARMAVQFGSGRPLPRYHEALVDLVRTEGPRNLFAGLRPTLMGIIPYSGLSFLTFETLKASIRKKFNLQRDRDIPTPLRLVAGGFAGLVAQSATYPLDIIRRRMQVRKLDATLSLYNAMKHVFESEGWRALYRGLSMNWIK
eukprot:gene696-1064_t